MYGAVQVLPSHENSIIRSSRSSCTNTLKRSVEDEAIRIDKDGRPREHIKLGTQKKR